MEIKNNPVGRLHDIYREASKLKDNTTTQAAWGAVLDAPAGDVGELLRLIADLIHLQMQAKQALIDGVDGDPAIFLAPFRKLDRIFTSIQLSAPWSHSRQYLDEATLSALAFGNHVLESKNGKTRLTSEEAADFIERLEQLLRECLESNLPEPLMKLFQKNLDGLRRALISYKISGAQGLEDEIDRVLGSVSRHSSDIRDQTDETSRGFMTSFFQVITNLNESIQLAETSAKLSAPAMLALLPYFQ